MQREEFQNLLKTIPFENYQTKSRVHPLRSFVFPETRCFVKREDELSFGVSGCKLRKYLSLVPYIIKEKSDEVVLLGTLYSNHILGLSQLLCEKGISPTLFLAEVEKELKGNALLTSLFVKRENRHFFEKSTWASLEIKAQKYALEKAKLGKKVLIVPYGGSCVPALWGSLTLSLDILRNEEELGVSFDHIFIDSGTGFTAASLLWGLTLLGKKITLHILHLGGEEKDFHNSYQSVQEALEKIREVCLPSPIPYFLHLPTNAKSFGSVNAEVIATCKELALTEGFLVDFLYNAKLFYEGKKVIQNPSFSIKGNVLFIHSGGALALTGFLDTLKT